MAIQSLGIGSGLLTTELLEGLLQAERAPVERRLNGDQASVEAQISALGEVRTALSRFSDSVNTLTQRTNFNVNVADSSDASVVSASALRTAEPGIYNVDVTQLAKTQSLASQGYADANTEVGTGTLTFRFGTTTTDVDGTYVGFEPNDDNLARSVTIDSSNNTLSGIRDAINKADIGVQASLVDDGSGYRLVMTSEESGASNSMEVTVDGDVGLDALAFNVDSQPMTQTVAAADAVFSVNGVDITRSSNEVSGAVPGTTLTLKDEGSSTVSVSRDPSELASPLKKFVDTYNSLKGVVDALTDFDPDVGENGAGSILTGDSLLRQMDSSVQRLLRSTITGLEGGAMALSEIGITTDQNNDYKLQFDEVAFTKAFNERPEDIMGLFASDGHTTDAQILYSNAGSETQPGTYDVNVSRHATKGQYTGLSVSALGAGNITVDDTNDRFVIDVNGTGAEITLDQATYATADELAQQIEAQINGNSRMVDNGYSVDVTFNATEQRFELVSSEYGSASNVRFTETDPAVANTLGLARDGEGPYQGSELASLSTPTGDPAENFDTAVTLEAATSFTLSVGGETSTLITIPGDAGTPVTYNTPQELIDAMQLEVDNALSGTTKSVTVGYSYDAESGTGRFTFDGNDDSDRISVSDTTAEASGKLGLFDGNGAASYSTVGVDVEGTINGVEAVGTGQYLRSPSGEVPAQSGYYLHGPHGDLSTSTVTDTFRIQVDGVDSGDIVVGSFSDTDPDTVASNLQTAINNDAALAAGDVSVQVEYDEVTGGFRIISDSTGTDSSVEITDLQGNTADILGFTTGTGDHGEAGTDATGEADPSAGLRLQVTGGPLGDRGTVSYVEGVATKMRDLLSGYLESDGLFDNRDESLQREMREIADQRDALNDRMERSEERLRASFLANDKIINRINSDADFLSSQLQMLEALVMPRRDKNK